MTNLAHAMCEYVLLGPKFARAQTAPFSMNNIQYQKPIDYGLLTVLMTKYSPLVGYILVVSDTVPWLHQLGYGKEIKNSTSPFHSS